MATTSAAQNSQTFPVHHPSDRTPPLAARAIMGLKMRADALKIDVFGDVGIATFILDYSYNSGGETRHAKERATMVFVKKGGSWKIVHEHLSAIKP
jgi:ketosteroid isomerase-like protein